MNTKFLNKMTLEDLREYPPLKELSEVVGVEVVVKLIVEFQSSEIYIPAAKSFKKLYGKYLMETYSKDGKLESIRRIAEKERCSRNYINICLNLAKGK